MVASALPNLKSLSLVSMVPTHADEESITRDAKEFARRAEAKWGPALRAERARDAALREYVDGVGARDRAKVRKLEEEQKKAKEAAAPRERADLDESELNEDELELKRYEESRRDNGSQPAEHEYEDNELMYPEGQPEGQRGYDDEEYDDETQPLANDSEETQVGVELPKAPKAPKAPAPPPVD